MYNANKPTADELPSTRQLVRSTIIAAVSAAVILVTIVLPAEYGIDPTRIGRVLGLTSMGEIKAQLAREALEDRESGGHGAPRSSLFQSIVGVLVGSAHAQDAAQPEWKETRTLVLKPGEGVEFKLVMDEGATAAFRWTAEGGRLNFDLHGDGAGQSISYEKGRGSPGEEGKLVAAFDGNHGWFWRNRSRADVTLTLAVGGDFKALKRTE